MPLTFASMFSGGGIADAGLVDAGLTHLWGIERDPVIAGHYESQIGWCYGTDVCDIDYRRLEAPDLLWASPPCSNYSVANVRQDENPEDLAAAGAVCRALDALWPPCFLLENVRQYRKSESLSRITSKLSSLGYEWDAAHVNAADVGVPQTRQRLIVRASRRGLAPCPAPVPWKGWYSAVEDLIDDLPAGKLGDWQAIRLPAGVRETLSRRPQDSESYLVSGKSIHPSGEITVRPGSDPSFTVLASTADRPCHVPLAVVSSGRNRSVAREVSASAVARGGAPAPFLVGSLLAHGGALTIRHADQPANTVCASQARRPVLACLPEWRVVRMTPRALARFQSVPEWYDLPDDPKLATKIIGNGAPSLLARRLAESMMGIGQKQAA